MSELGSWVGLYHWVVEKLMRERMVAERDVLTVLAMRANPLGFCWPGTGYIAELIGRADSTVENALRRLELMDFICVVRTQNLIRNRIDIDFQVRPDVMLIAPDKFDLASHLWEQNRNVNVRNVTEESQPPPGTRILKPEPGISTRTTTTTKQLSVNGKSPDESPTPVTPKPENAKGENPKDGEKNSGAAAIPPAATPQSKTPSPVPVSPSPLVASPDALPDELAESIAAQINAATRYQMSLAVARGLVVKHGVTKCEAALAHMALQTNVNSPAGYLRFKLEQNEIDPVADGKTPVEEADVNVFKNSIYADRYYKPEKSSIENDPESRDE